MEWWQELLIRENTTPGAIANYVVETHQQERVFSELAKKYSEANEELQQNKDISNYGISSMVDKNEISTNNISRIAEALREKTMQLPVVVLAKKLNKALVKLEKNPNDFEPLVDIIKEYRAYEPKARKESFENMVKVNDEEELMDSLFAVMKDADFTYGSELQTLVTLLPNITRSKIISRGRGQQEPRGRVYEVVPLDRFTDTLQNPHTTLDRFKILIQNVLSAWRLNNKFSFYTRRLPQGRVTVGSPMYILYNVLKYTKDKDIFTTASYGATLGRREQVGAGKYAKMYRLFAEETAKTDPRSVEEIIELAKQPRTLPGSMREEFDNFMATSPLTQGKYFTSGETIKEVTDKLFPTDIDAKAVYMIAYPDDSSGDLSLGDSLLGAQFPSDIETATPLKLLKAHLHVIRNFNPEAINSLMRLLDDIRSEMLELETEVDEDDIFAESGKIFNRTTDGTYSVDVSQLKIVDQSKVKTAVEKFITKFKQELEKTAENIAEDIHKMVSNDINTQGQGKFSIAKKETGNIQEYLDSYDRHNGKATTNILVVSRSGK
tara:strand:+ start:105 stop:1754 length:1650 start_codon:yes stop_codon:yes gene_type:complete